MHAYCPLFLVDKVVYCLHEIIYPPSKNALLIRATFGEQKGLFNVGPGLCKSGIVSGIIQ